MTAAWAKLNLSLAIGSRQSNGYHSLVSLFQRISLKDDLSFDPLSDRSGIEFHVEYDPDLPDKEVLGWDSSNTIYRVARAMIAHGIEIPSGRFGLFKRIPMKSGLGGGSSDAAAFIRMIHKTHPIPQTIQRQLAQNAGCDAPFFLDGGTAIVSGMGEKIRALPPLPKCPVLLVRPERGFSTPVMYARLDQYRMTSRIEFDHFIDESKAMELYGRLMRQRKSAFRNDFLEVVRGLDSETDKWWDVWEGFHDPEMILKGMSGSGSVCFAVFTTQVSGERIDEMRRGWRNRGYWSETAYFSGEDEIDAF